MKKKFLSAIAILAATALFGQTNFDFFLGEQGLPSNPEATYVVTDNYQSRGFRNIYLAQKVHGVPVYGSSIHLIEVKNSLILLPSRYIQEPQKEVFEKGNLTIEQAFGLAFQQLNVTDEGKLTSTEEYHPTYTIFSHPQVEGKAYGGYVWYQGEVGIRHAIFASFEPKGHSEWHNFVIDARTSEIIEEYTYTSECSFDEHTFVREAEAFTQQLSSVSTAKTAASGSYRVLELPIESPVHGSLALISNPHSLTASPFGWHDVDGSAGAEFTITRGNNVHAYEDRGNNNQPGYSPDGGALLNFDFPFTLNLDIDSILDASITNLFYVNNMMHDIMYYYGFDEASGNFQENNYGRGGLEEDEVRAESQDGSGTNNANFSTPVDGNRPRMQMYLWNRPGSSGSNNILRVNSPASIAGSYPATKASFGPQIGNTAITANAVIVDDGTTSGSEGCNPLTNGSAVSGKIAIIDRGNCTFISKILNAQAAGAIAVIMVNNTVGSPIVMGGTGGSAVTIPSVMVSQAIGNNIKAQLALGNVNITLRDSAGSYLFDSSFDNGVVAHEFGHGISIRLTGGPGVSNCLNNQEQAGEGWSDFFGLALTTKATDNGAIGRGMAPFLANGNVNGNGIRPARYSTNMNVNPLTYNNMSQVSVPHGIGTIFASALWDMYWFLIDKYGFDEDWTSTTGGNNIAMQLVIDGLKLQPCRPGFIDSRDAILLADSLFYNSANKCEIWTAFARRGMGVNADQGLATSVGDGTPNFDIPVECFGISVDEFDAPNTIKIFPNPAQDYIEIQSPVAADVAWYSPTGAAIDVPANELSNNHLRFSTNHLPSGVYILHIKMGGKTETTRVVIQR